MSDDKCPVDHAARERFLRESPLRPKASSSAPATTALPTERVISSIPRFQDGSGNWVYPSQAQFYKALQQKQHDPNANDMSTVVPIHNAVNERAWRDILAWEREVGAGDEALEQVKLVSFLGKPGEASPRARLRTLLGYNPPFDRHDWLVDRNGTRVRYIIDFYSGGTATTGNISFFLDARPALDGFEGVRMRATRFMQRIWRGRYEEERRRQDFERLRAGVALATSQGDVQEREV